MEKISNILKITGLIAIAIGITIHFIDLKGYLRDKERIEILNWTLNSDIGLPIESLAAREFMEKFPPPQSENKDIFSHLTKSVLKTASGKVFNASVNYMRKDGTRTNDVVTLEEIRMWAYETPYSWISWWLDSFGFLVLLVNFWIRKRMSLR